MKYTLSDIEKKVLKQQRFDDVVDEKYAKSQLKLLLLNPADISNNNNSNSNSSSSSNSNNNNNDDDDSDSDSDVFGIDFDNGSSNDTPPKNSDRKNNNYFETKKIFSSSKKILLPSISISRSPLSTHDPSSRPIANAAAKMLKKIHLILLS